MLTQEQLQAIKAPATAAPLLGRTFGSAACSCLWQRSADGSFVMSSRSESHTNFFPVRYAMLAKWQSTADLCDDSISERGVLRVWTQSMKFWK